MAKLRIKKQKKDSNIKVTSTSEPDTYSFSYFEEKEDFYKNKAIMEVHVDHFTLEGLYEQLAEINIKIKAIEDLNAQAEDHLDVELD